MDAPVDSWLPGLAAELGLAGVSPPARGEFGALLVADDTGRELVLKSTSRTATEPLPRHERSA
ncbi:MAG: hypothetical protein WEB19_03755 [Acidimicrobiia bacterium]